VAEALADILHRQLAVYLGPHSARSTVRTVAERVCGKAPEALGPSDVQPLLAALEPTLRTLLGSDQAEAVLAALAAELVEVGT
jgi:hypothetical protein